MVDAARCPGETQFKPTAYSGHHTVRCQKDAGHDGGHEWKQDNREVIWFGEPKKAADNTRFRYGHWLEKRG